MKEFVLYIRNQKDAKNSLTSEEHLEFIKKCEDYIQSLKSENRLLAAQPLFRDGIILKKIENGWNETDIAFNIEVHVGYYQILARDLQEAIEIAKFNPEFEYIPSASIEVRQIKTIEIETGFVYPNNNL